MDEPVTAKVVGDWLGVSDRTISDLAIRGLAVRIGRGKYDLHRTVQLYSKHLREVAAARGGEGQILDLTAERARLAKEQADGQELKNKQARGELLLAPDVAREWIDIQRRVRGGVLAVTSRVRARLPHLTPADAVEIDSEIRLALEALSNDDRDDAPDGDGGPAAATPA